MIDPTAFFTDFKKCSTEHVMFGDGVRGKILDKGSINQPGLPYLQDVRLVKGLSVNLISINKLCNQDFSVKFIKEEFLVFDKENKVILSGTWLSDNCYDWDSEMSICNMLKSNEANVWHRCLGHISVLTICKTIGAYAILGILILKYNICDFCNGCLVGKLIKASNQFTSQCVPLEFLNSYTWT